MKKVRTLTDFSKYGDGNFETKAQSIFTAMTGNLNFPSPVPDIAAFTASLKSYSDALSEAKSRDKVKVAIKNETRVQLETMLVNLSNSVMQTSAGSRSMLISSGFNVSSDGSSPQPPFPTTTKNFQVVAGTSPGEVISSVNSVKGSKSYIHQYTADPITPESAWTQVYSSSRKATTTGLESLKKYWFRIIITGTKSQTVQTDVISKIVV